MTVFDNITIHIKRIWTYPALDRVLVVYSFSGDGVFDGSSEEKLLEVDV